MAEPVAERLAEPRLLDHVARGPVGVLALDTGADGRETRRLRPLDDLVGPPELVWQLASSERARAVRAVAADSAGRVDENCLASPDQPLAGDAVG